MRKLYALAREKGLDNDLLHDMVRSQCKQEHISDLTIKQAAKLIDSLASTRTVPLPSGRPLHLVSYKQLYKIRQLEAALGWSDNASRLRGFIKKYAGSDNVEWLTKEQAWRVIEGMKALLARGDEKDGITMG